MRVVVDTNVFVSGVFFGGPPGRVLAAWRDGTIEVVVSPLPEPVCSDPDDDKFLACAIAAGATHVVSGDRGLLASSPYRKVIVIRPRELVDRLTRREH